MKLKGKVAAKATAPRGAGAARVHAELRRRILALELAPGSDLDEAALAAAFRVSRTPVREALNRLASERLVETAPNRGASVAPLNLADFPAFIESLALAQAAVNAFAATRRSEAEAAAITAAAERFEAALDAQTMTLTAANRAFHGVIAGAAHNPYLAGFYERLLDEGARLARLSFSYAVAGDAPGQGAHLAEVAAEHRQMAEAVAARDARHAERLGHAHAALFQRRVLAWLSSNDAALLTPVATPTG